MHGNQGLDRFDATDAQSRPLFGIYRCEPTKSRCAACDELVNRVWAAGDRAVCHACKDWKSN